ncbi:DDE superfamily endonuclease [uncultured archaeon]|nr:DDE superfamily endonuclease [uncultured archaeon]
MTPQEPEGREAQDEDKAYCLMNLGDGKGSAPRKALSRIELSNLNSDAQEFVSRIPIGGISPNGPRSEEWQRIGANYLTGQILPGRRKSMEPITKRIPDEDYQRMQQFITDSTWDAKATTDAMISFLSDKIAKPDGVIIIDDTGCKKQGKMSPGVARQYFSEKAFTGNCQVTVTSIYSDSIGPTNADIINWPLGMILYLPESWSEDSYRRKQAGIPSSKRYQTKEKLALSLIENARERNVPHKVILADTWYGRIYDFRDQLREWKEPYIVGILLDGFQFVDADTPILLPGAFGKYHGRKRVHPVLSEGAKCRTPRQIADMNKDWKTITWAEGTKGDLTARFTRRKVRTIKNHKVPSEEISWLLLEDGAEGLKAFICWGLDDLSLADLVRLAHMRWAIEDYHKQIKDRLGFDHFQGRKYRGWLHHAVLTQMTYALLAWLRWKQRDFDGEISLPTLPEVRRLLLMAIVEHLQIAQPRTGGRRYRPCKACPLKRLVLEAA